MRKFAAIAAAFALTATMMAPTTAAARDPRGGYDRHHDGGRYDHRGRRHYRGHDDNDALAVGVIGLVLGLAIGAAVTQPRAQSGDCTADYQHCAPPPGYGYEYYGKPEYDEGYGPSYDQGQAYGQDYSAPPAQTQCTRRERQWDRYANQYVTVDVPC